MQTAGESGGCLGCPCPSSHYCGSQGNIVPCWTREVLSTGVDGSLWPFWATLCHLPSLLQDPAWYQGHQRPPASFLGGKVKDREAPHLGIQPQPSHRTPRHSCPAGQMACARHWATHPPTGVQVLPHRVSTQHGLSARGLLTAMKPARPHSCGWSGAGHSTGVHCTDTVPLSHTQSWQLLTHHSPGCNRPGQGPPGLLGGALASGVTSSSRLGPGLPVPGAAVRLMWLTPVCATPAPTLPPDPGQTRGPGRGTPALLPLKQGVGPLRAEHLRIWEARLVPHRLRGKNGEKGVSGSAGAQPAWPPLPQWRPCLPAWVEAPGELKGGHLGGGSGRLQATLCRWQDCPPWGPSHSPGLGGPSAGCLRHSGTQMSLWELKRMWPSGQKQPSASSTLSGLWLLQGDKGRLRGRTVGTVQAWGQPGVRGGRSGGGRAPPRSGAGVLEPRGSPPAPHQVLRAGLGGPLSPLLSPCQLGSPGVAGLRLHGATRLVHLGGRAGEVWGHTDRCQAGRGGQGPRRPCPTHRTARGWRCASRGRRPGSGRALRRPPGSGRALHGRGRASSCH